MIKTLPSLYATNRWGKSGVYDAPARQRAYDTNFDYATKLPPTTPGLEKIRRRQWATVASSENAVAKNP